MTKNKKQRIGERKKEEYYKKAKEIKVRSRAYFKLEQINKKFNIISEGMKILDLGCAPGGWIEYIDKNFQNINIVGIDLLEVKNQRDFSENVKIIQDDFNNIKEYNLGVFDLIISDMAPEFSGNSTFDRGRTHKLNLQTIEFSKKHLKKNGNLVFKSFEGEDLPYVRKKAKEIFKIVKEFKPKSSQKKSAETFIICLNKIN
jgi:23S rRNA (uridine2552-2'-O)-methyltransferase